MESKSDEWIGTRFERCHNLCGFGKKGLSLEDNFADIYGTKYGKEVIWTIHFEIYEKEAQYSQSLKPRDVFVEKAVNKDEIPYAKGGARSTYAPSPFLIGLFNANPADIRTKDSYITAKDADGNEIGTLIIR